jgi:NAD(P)-dependent dehydrogenase (short-subunit alcohol dehydrogenase family)
MLFCRYVYLGARDRSRGEVALRRIVEKNPGAAGRAEVLTLDVSSDASVAEAAATVAAHGTIYGLVNNG